MTTQRQAGRGFGSLGSGAVTAAALAVQQGTAAAVGIVIAREFGRGAETDGFFAAYGVFLAVAIAATAARLVFLPPLARARTERRLAGETTASALALSAVTVPLVLVSIVAASAIAAVLTGFDDGAARHTAAAALPWLVAAGAAQLYAGLAASALAALDDYRTPALGYALGGVLGLGFIVWRVDGDGIDAVAWGMAVNGAVAAVVPTVALVLRARREGVVSEAARPVPPSGRGRLSGLAAGVALPLALQAVYVVCLPFAAGEGVGATTSLGYAYLAGSAVIMVTASALALVTSVPLTRIGLDPAGVARHVTASAWLALVAVGATTGLFAVAGEPIADAVLGASYGSDVGRDLGRLVVALAPWMLVTVGVTAAFPLVFVMGRGRGLPVLSLGMVAVHVPLAWLGDALAGLYGLAVALAASTAIGLVWMLVTLRAAAATLRALALAAAAVTAAVACSFGPAGWLLAPAPAALVGTALYAAILAVVRPPGLRSAWSYLRAL